MHYSKLSIVLSGVGIVLIGLAGARAMPDILSLIQQAQFKVANSEIVLPEALVGTPVLPTRAPDVTDVQVDHETFFQSEPTALPGAPKPQLTGVVPDRIVIPKINLDAPVVLATTDTILLGGNKYLEWKAPNQFAAGWHVMSAELGNVGNTVLNGHNNEFGEVFLHLADLKSGDTIQLYGKGQVFNYQVTNVMILPERDQPISVRLENARWLEPTQDERVTLVSCWPHISNTHRVIVVAQPQKNLKP
jgi:LPXTG-site transpeptidase (sortase) family protein